jgi:hypothetical protein
VAKYRPIFTKIWDDPDFQDYRPSEKLVFLYLCTNPSTTESGIYPISPRSIAQGTGIGMVVVKKMLDEQRIKNVLYDSQHKIVFLRNFLEYNGKGRPDLVLKSIYNDFKYIRTPLWDAFKKRYPLFYERLLDLKKELEKTSKPKPNPNHIPSAKPMPNANLTQNQYTDEKGELIDDKVVEDMRAIFVTYWEEHNEGEYIPDYDREKIVAAKLHAWCVKERPCKPLAVFGERVEHLVRTHNIRQFSGLLRFWNAAGM